jgi:hypothetical protein
MPTNIIILKKIVQKIYPNFYKKKYLFYKLFKFHIRIHFILIKK